MEQRSFIGLLAPREFSSELEKELKLKNIPILHQYERLFIVEAINTDIIWVDDIFYDLKITSFNSISEAQKILKSQTKNWVHFKISSIRRGELILSELGKINAKRIDFLGELKKTKFGVFGLIDEKTLLHASHTRSPIPLGTHEFNEDKTNPPSRAYLKLWEVFSLHQVTPRANQKVIDVGSCPGGWTWVLANLNCHVISVDKAPLEEKVAKRKEVEFLKQSAFGLDPLNVGKLDWFFSDIICYPERLFELVKKFHDTGMCSNFVCTLKFQGETDYKAMDQFLTFPGSKIIHLYHNKHEVTWIYLKDEAPRLWGLD